MLGTITGAKDLMQLSKLYDEAKRRYGEEGELKIARAARRLFEHSTQAGKESFLKVQARMLESAKLEPRLALHLLATSEKHSEMYDKAMNVVKAASNEGAEEKNPGIHLKIASELEYLDKEGFKKVHDAIIDLAYSKDHHILNLLYKYSVKNEHRGLIMSAIAQPGSFINAASPLMFIASNFPGSEEQMLKMSTEIKKDGSMSVTLAMDEVSMECDGAFSDDGEIFKISEELVRNFINALSQEVVDYLFSVEKAEELLPTNSKEIVLYDGSERKYKTEADKVKFKIFMEYLRAIKKT